MKKIIDFFEKNFYIFIVYAVIGWIYEVVWHLIVKNMFVNRGFLFGPYLPIYGFGAIVLYYILWKFKEKKHKIGKIDITPILVFILIFIITTVIEFIAHLILDQYFGIVLWDYTNDYWNIDGRVCFAASRNFAIGGTIGLYLIQPIIEKTFKKMPSKRKHLIFIPLFIIVLLDFIIVLIK